VEIFSCFLVLSIVDSEITIIIIIIITIIIIFFLDVFIVILIVIINMIIISITLVIIIITIIDIHERYLYHYHQTYYILTAQESVSIGTEGGSVVLAIATALYTFPFNTKADPLTLDLIESCVQALLGTYFHFFTHDFIYSYFYFYLSTLFILWM
jgi:NADH:ubiquinone oxidoreductase subunit 2 (subunit N)